MLPKYLQLLLSIYALIGCARCGKRMHHIDISAAAELLHKAEKKISESK